MSVCLCPTLRFISASDPASKAAPSRGFSRRHRHLRRGEHLRSRRLRFRNHQVHLILNSFLPLYPLSPISLIIRKSRILLIFYNCPLSFQFQLKFVSTSIYKSNGSRSHDELGYREDDDDEDVKGKVILRSSAMAIPKKKGNDRQVPA